MTRTFSAPDIEYHMKIQPTRGAAMRDENTVAADLASEMEQTEVSPEYQS